MPKAKIERKIIALDAAGEIYGRFASRVAKLLMGKHKKEYLPYIDIGDIVVIANVGNLKFTGKKFDQKTYCHHTGYLGHLKEEKMRILYKRNPVKLFQQTVYNMLPVNRLRRRRMKRLKFLK